MRTACSIACFLAPLLFEGHALLCIYCFSSTDPWCTGIPVMCHNKSDVCFSKYTVTKSGLKKPTTRFTRNCGTKTNICDKIESVTAIYIQIRGNTTCCSTDNCEPVMPIVPELSTYLNGVVCRTCLSPKSTYCYSEKTMFCRGIETKCVLYGIKRLGKLSSIAYRGCGSPDSCFNDVYTRTYNKIVKETTRACSNKVIHLQNSCSFMVLTLFLLILCH